MGDERAEEEGSGKDVTWDQTDLRFYIEQRYKKRYMDVICGIKETAECVKALHFDTIEEIKIEVITNEFMRCIIKILTWKTPYSLE